MNSMKDILSAFDTAGNTKSATPSATNSMKHLLESIDKIQESASMNISMSGDSPDDIARLMKSITGAETDTDSYDAEPVDYGNDGYADHEQDVFQGTLSGSGTMNRELEAYNNEPDEQYADCDDVADPPSDDLNRKKKGYPRAEPGDNPMSVRESELKEELSRSLREHMKRLKL